MKIISFLILLISINVLPAQSEENDEGKEIFNFRCGDVCHQLPEPAMLKANQWRIILNVMQQRMKQKGMEPLTKEELEKVFDYLKEKAKK